jgi:hypothetical protein
MSTRASMLVGRSTSTPPQKTRATAEAVREKGHFYKPLPKEFRRDGFVYRRIANEGVPRYTNRGGAAFLTRAFAGR